MCLIEVVSKTDTFDSLQITLTLKNRKILSVSLNMKDVKADPAYLDTLN